MWENTHKGHLQKNLQRAPSFYAALCFGKKTCKLCILSIKILQSMGRLCIIWVHFLTTKCQCQTRRVWGSHRELVVSRSLFLAFVLELSQELLMAWGGLQWVCYHLQSSQHLAHFTSCPCACSKLHCRPGSIFESV